MTGQPKSDQNAVASMSKGDWCLVVVVIYTIAAFLFSLLWYTSLSNHAASLLMRHLPVLLVWIVLFAFAIPAYRRGLLSISVPEENGKEKSAA